MQQPAPLARQTTYSSPAVCATPRMSARTPGVCSSRQPPLPLGASTVVRTATGAKDPPPTVLPVRVASTYIPMPLVEIVQRTDGIKTLVVRVAPNATARV